MRVIFKKINLICKKYFLLEKAHPNILHHNIFLDYENVYSYIRFICPKHGEFKSSVRNHLKSRFQCPKCSYDQRDNKRYPMKEDKFIEECKKVHNNFYDYSKTTNKKIYNLIGGHSECFDYDVLGICEGDLIESIKND